MLYPKSIDGAVKMKNVYPVKTLNQFRPLLIGFRKARGLIQKVISERLEQTYTRLEANSAFHARESSLAGKWHVIILITYYPTVKYTGVWRGATGQKVTCFQSWGETV